MTRRLALMVPALLALSVVGCGSEGSSSESAVTTDVVVTEPAVTEPPVTEPAVTEPPDTQPATTAASETTEPASTEPDAPPARAVEIDDDPVCQSLARVWAAGVFQGLAGMFGGGDGTAEKIELYFAPALAPDVVLIRAQGDPAFQPFPTLARIEAGNVALVAGGFTDEELVALAASGNDTIDSVLAGSEPDFESVGPAPGAEAKLTAAAEAFLADVGTVDEYDVTVADPAAEAAFNEALPTQCPMLVASFDSE